ncbi:MAG TPA: HEAT repeat domain-containing protein [Blastocatellia bacterium]|nr:HEAT repeat domain-containing protein [Blastocatellia bacterium]
MIERRTFLLALSITGLLFALPAAPAFGVRGQTAAGGVNLREKIAQLSSPDAVTRARAACAIGSQGASAAEAIPALIELLDDGTQIEPSQSCGNAPPFEDEAWEPSFYQLKEPSPGEAATLALVSINGPAVRPLADVLARAEHWRARKNAAWALAHTADAEAVKALIRALKDPAWQVRAQAAYALSQRGGDQAEDLLTTALLTDLAWQVRAMAALALGQKGSRRAVDHLIAALNDDNSRVRDHVKLALTMKGYAALYKNSKTR